MQLLTNSHLMPYQSPNNVSPLPQPNPPFYCSVFSLEIQKRSIILATMTKVNSLTSKPAQ